MAGAKGGRAPRARRSSGDPAEAGQKFKLSCVAVFLVAGAGMFLARDFGSVYDCYDVVVNDSAVDRVKNYFK